VRLRRRLCYAHSHCQQRVRLVCGCRPPHARRLRVRPQAAAPESKRHCLRGRACGAKRREEARAWALKWARGARARALSRLGASHRRRVGWLCVCLSNSYFAGPRPPAERPSPGRTRVSRRDDTVGNAHVDRTPFRRPLPHPSDGTNDVDELMTRTHPHTSAAAMRAPLRASPRRPPRLAPRPRRPNFGLGRKPAHTQPVGNRWALGGR